MAGGLLTVLYSEFLFIVPTRWVLSKIRTKPTSTKPSCSKYVGRSIGSCGMDLFKTQQGRKLFGRYFPFSVAGSWYYEMFYVYFLCLLNLQVNFRKCHSASLTLSIEYLIMVIGQSFFDCHCSTLPC